MKKKNKILSIAMVFIFAIAFLTPTLSMPATALADPSVDSSYSDNGDLSVVTDDADDIDYDEATLTAYVDEYDEDYYNITEYGFFWGDDDDDVDDVEDILLDMMNDEGEDDWNCEYDFGDDENDDENSFEFSLDLTDLDEDTTYYYRAYIEYEDDDYNLYYSLGDVEKFDADEDSSSDKPEVTTGSATEIDDDSAVLNGTIESYGDDNEITEYGFYYGTSSSPTTKKMVGDDEDNIDEGDDFDYDLSGLKADTKYYFKAYAKNSEGIAYGSIKSFTTKSAVVTTPSVFTIGSNYYFLNGTNQFMEAAPYIKSNRTYMPIRYVGYAMGLTDSQIQWYEATRTVILTKGSTTVVLVIGSPTIFVNGVARTMDVSPEITNNRTCLPIAWVAAAFGTTAVWDPVGRTVTIPAAATVPAATGEVEVATSSATSIGSDYATLNGKVTDSSGLSIKGFGFYYGTSKTKVADGADGSAKKVTASGTKDSFYKKITSLDEDTTYYFMSYAIDENDNITYGTVKSFTTKDSYDKPSVTTLSAKEIDDESAVLNGRITSFGDDDEITEYGFYYGTSSSPTTRKKVGDDSDNIDEGDDFDYTLTGLKADTKYYFKAYAKNSEGIAYGSVKSFITD